MSKPYYSIDFDFKPGDVVAITDITQRFHERNPAVCRVISVHNKPFGSTGSLGDCILVVQCQQTKVISKVDSGNVTKYDTFLIFWIMAFYKRLIRAHFHVDVDVF